MATTVKREFDEEFGLIEMCLRYHTKSAGTAYFFFFLEKYNVCYMNIDEVREAWEAEYGETCSEQLAETLKSYSVYQPNRMRAHNLPMKVKAYKCTDELIFDVLIKSDLTLTVRYEEMIVIDNVDNFYQVNDGEFDDIVKQ